MSSQRLLRHLSVLRTIPVVSAASSRPVSSSAFIAHTPCKFRTASLTHYGQGIRSMSSQPSSDDLISQYSNVELEGNNVGYAMEMLAKADAVCFDVDSTVIDEEGIVSHTLYNILPPYRYCSLV